MKIKCFFGFHSYVFNEYHSELVKGVSFYLRKCQYCNHQGDTATRCKVEGCDWKDTGSRYKCWRYDMYDHFEHTEEVQQCTRCNNTRRVRI
jgi:hypothetical protein